MDNFVGYLMKAAKQYNIHLSEYQIKQFNNYFELLVEWNEKVNLTAITAPQEVAVKHMIDSLSCYDAQLFPENCSLIDVGTGAGFPGIPLKIFRPDIKLTLLDSLNKRLLFLKEVVDRLDLQGVEIVHMRAEDAGRENKFREKFDIAVSRAVARLPVLAEICLPFVSLKGYFVALKGAKFQQEVDESVNAQKILGAKIISVNPVKLPDLEDIRAVIYMQKIKPMPTMYPRRPGIPEKNPLL